MNDPVPPAAPAPRRMTRRALITGLAVGGAGAAAGAAAALSATGDLRHSSPLPGTYAPRIATPVGAVPSDTDLIVRGTGTAAIQSAIDAAPDRGVVRLPSGTVHDVTTLELRDKDVVVAMQGATINTTVRDSYAFVQQHRRRLTIMGGTVTGHGSGVRYSIPPDEQQSYDFVADSVTFSVAPTQAAIRLTGVREATINQCFFDTCTGIVLDQSVNTHVTNCQFRNCPTGVFGDGLLTGTPYDAGLMISNATMLGCDYGVRAACWDWVAIINSMIDYCDRPVELTNVDGASITSSYLSNRDAEAGPFPVLQILSDEKLPGVRSQHIKVSQSIIVGHVEQTPEKSIGVRLHDASWCSLTDTTIHFWLQYGVFATGACESLRLHGNVIKPGPNAQNPVALEGAGGNGATWIISENVLGAPVRNVLSALLRDNV
jgi:hypothetical protein